MTYWEPLTLFSTENYQSKFALIVLNQKLKLPITIYCKLWENATYIVAADGGANQLHSLNHLKSPANLRLDAIIGDLDSLKPQVRQYWGSKGVPIIHKSDQNSTDLMKAARHIRDARGNAPLDIVILGGLGGRVDQGMSVLNHLLILQKEKSYASGQVFLISNRSISFTMLPGAHIVRAAHFLDGIALGDNVGILPLNGPSTISTTGLEWNVSDWKTEIGGQVSTSNHVKNDIVTIHTSKDVLFTIDLDLTAFGLSLR